MMVEMPVPVAKRVHPGEQRVPGPFGAGPRQRGPVGRSGEVRREVRHVGRVHADELGQQTGSGLTLYLTFVVGLVIVVQQFLLVSFATIRSVA